MKLNLYFSAIFLSLTYIYSSSLNAQPGTLDAGFGTGGSVTTTIGTGNGFGASILVQTDGKLILAGHASSVGSDHDFTLTRFTANGVLDNTFGVGGKVTTPIGTYDNRAFSAALQLDGKIVVGGSSDTHPTGNGCMDFTVARYNTDGSLDNTFGTNGISVTHFGDPCFSSHINAIAIHSDGKIVAAGHFNGGSFPNDFVLARYNSDGTLDNNFGIGGQVTTTFGNSSDVPYAIAIQADGKILAAGNSDIGTNMLNDFALARYNYDGSLDNTFGLGGFVVTDINSGDEYIRSLALQGDGKIVAVGYTTSPTYDFAMARYNTDGSLDNTFGNNGKVTTDFANSSDYGTSVLINTSGQIFIGGFTTDNFALACYTPNGLLDNTFGLGGKVDTDISTFGSYDYSYCSTLQSDGKIVLGGMMYQEFALARYEGYGVININENKNWQSTISISPNPANEQFTIETQINEEQRLQVIDLNGKLILSQNINGTSTINTTTLNEGVYSVSIKTAGHITNKKLVIIR